MRVRPDDLRVHERRALARARVGNGVGHGAIAGKEVRAVDALDEESWKGRDEPRDIATRRLHFDGNRDRVAVVFDDIHDRQLAEARRVERLPELAFARRPVADRDVGHFVPMKARVPILDRRDALVEQRRFSAADGLEALRPRRARLRHDVQLFVAPMGRHLTPARGRVVLRADRGEEHLERRHADGQAKGPVAIVGIEPVVRRFELHAGGDEDRLVPGAADLKEDQALVLELDFLVVNAAGEHHRPIGSEKVLAGEPMGVEWAGRVAL